MAKIIKLKPRIAPKSGPARARPGICLRCRHKMDVHITHPDGSTSCAVRGCGCRTAAPA